MPNKHVEIELTWFEKASDATVTTSVVALLYNRTGAACFKWSGFTISSKQITLYFASVYA